MNVLASLEDLTPVGDDVVHAEGFELSGVHAVREREQIANVLNFDVLHHVVFAHCLQTFDLRGCKQGYTENSTIIPGIYQRP